VNRWLGASVATSLVDVAAGIEKLQSENRNAYVTFLERWLKFTLRVCTDTMPLDFICATGGLLLPTAIPRNLHLLTLSMTVTKRRQNEKHLEVCPQDPRQPCVFNPELLPLPRTVYTGSVALRRPAAQLLDTTIWFFHHERLTGG
jgi:hypothetical protein